MAAAAAFCKQLQTNARISFLFFSIPFQVRIQSERTVNCKHIHSTPNDLFEEPDECPRPVPAECVCVLREAFSRVGKKKNSPHLVNCLQFSQFSRVFPSSEFSAVYFIPN